MFCRLCLNVINGENYTVIEETIKIVLGDLLLKLSEEHDIKPLICHDCSTKLFAAFEFKAMCLDTEDNILTYVNSENRSPADLKEIYLKEKEEEHSTTLSEDQRICRLCMAMITLGFTSVEDVKFDLINKFIPEVDFNSTKDPVICTGCLDSLKTHTSFLKNCLDTEDQIQHFRNKKENQYIKFEEVNIKTTAENEGKNTDVPLPSDQPVTGKIDGKNGPKPQRKHDTDARTYTCYTCNYKTKIRNYFVRHQLIHKDASEVQLHECSICEFKSKYKSSLANHRLRHKYFSEGRVYACNTCSFTTKHKASFTMHRKTHKTTSDAPKYKCQVCGYETDLKSNFQRHRLIHKDASQVQMYNCNLCDYKNRDKNNLVRHQLLHNKAQTYKCDICGYTTQRKSYLLRHLPIHRDLSEVKTHVCEICNYRSRQKSNFLRHQVLHKDSSEVPMYRCEMCDYVTKHKGCLRKHQVRHKHIPEVQNEMCESSNT